MQREEVKRLLARGVLRFKFCIRLYREQLQNGRYFLHERPVFATSWGLTAMIQLLQHPDVLHVRGGMCRHGMAAGDAQGEGLVLKPAGLGLELPIRR